MESANALSLAEFLSLHLAAERDKSSSAAESSASAPSATAESTSVSSSAIAVSSPGTPPLVAAAPAASLSDADFAALYRPLSGASSASSDDLAPLQPALIGAVAEMSSPPFADSDHSREPSMSEPWSDVDEAALTSAGEDDAEATEESKQQQS